MGVKAKTNFEYNASMNNNNGHPISSSSISSDISVLPLQQQLQHKQDEGSMQIKPLKSMQARRSYIGMKARRKHMHGIMHGHGGMEHDNIISMMQHNVYGMNIGGNQDLNFINIHTPFHYGAGEEEAMHEPDLRMMHPNKLMRMNEDIQSQKPSKSSYGMGVVRYVLCLCSGRRGLERADLLLDGRAEL